MLAASRQGLTEASNSAAKVIAPKTQNAEAVVGEVVSTFTSPVAEASKSPVPEVLPTSRTLAKTISRKHVDKFMPWVELFWHKHHRYPSNGELMERFGLDLDSIQRLNVSKLWLKALERRGITPPNVAADFLSNRQIAAITVLTNYHDTRSPVAKLASLGISEEELNGWYKNPIFKRAMVDRSEEVLDNVAVDANVQLATLIRKGDFKAIKFYFDITGKSQSPEVANIKQTLQILVEAVQKHVSDPKLLDAIANEVQQVRGISGL